MVFLFILFFSPPYQDTQVTASKALTSVRAYFIHSSHRSCDNDLQLHSNDDQHAHRPPQSQCRKHWPAVPYQSLLNETTSLFEPMTLFTHEWHVVDGEWHNQTPLPPLLSAQGSLQIDRYMRIYIYTYGSPPYPLHL